MRQEHRFCAEVYHRLYPHIDFGRAVYLCLDGMAARNGVTQGLLLDDVVPDFIFYFVNAKCPRLFTMEAKVVEDGMVKFCGRGQTNAWGPDGANQYTPVLWIATNEDLTQFYLWQHEHFMPLLANGPNAQGNLDIPPQEHVAQFDSMDALVEEILKFARERGYYPNVEIND